MKGALPEELDNTDFWQWTWLILLTFIVSGGGWLVGYTVYLPFTTVLNFYNFGVLAYSTQILFFEEPQRLTFDVWA